MDSLSLKHARDTFDDPTNTTIYSKPSGMVHINKDSVYTYEKRGGPLFQTVNNDILQSNNNYFVESLYSVVKKDTSRHKQIKNAVLHEAVNIGIPIGSLEYHNDQKSKQLCTSMMHDNCMYSTAGEMDKQPIHWSQSAFMVSDNAHKVTDANNIDPIYQTVDLEERLDTTWNNEDLSNVIETKPKHDCMEVNKSMAPIDANVCADDPLYSVVNKKAPKGNADVYLL
ncbi:hypothetical protein DPMN_041272 [Dreissena polymorpha]|uniref:Uncharacterized protein n=1 Tax=Dreissena polymorpha TaxID=45954 RepID=A0A9D4CZW4_DREPO|nr:hypothetical protein DPMN_041272 [Dreissena polymorpha]